MSLSAIQNRINVVAKSKGRDPEDVKLVAISKVHPEDRVRHVLEQGHRLFGENRVQEAEGRWTPLKEEFADVELHLVGPLQTNKARAAFGLFDAIHSIDRPKLANTCARLSDETGKEVEINLSNIIGEHCTYKIQEKEVEAFGPDAKRYSQYLDVPPEYHKYL